MRCSKTYVRSRALCLARGATILWRKEDDQILCVSHIERLTCPFVDHVPIEALGPHERDVLFHALAIRLGGGQFRLERGDTFLQLPQREHAVVSLHRVIGEVAHDEQTAEREEQRPCLRLLTLTCRHRPLATLGTEANEG